jgi:hypothetical protein
MSYELSLGSHRSGFFDRKKHAFETSSNLAIKLKPFTMTEIDPAPESLMLDKAIWRKMDLWLLPTVAMFHLLSFLVRRT